MSSSLDIPGILQAIRSTLPAGKPLNGLHEPEFSGNDWLYVKECIDTGWVSSTGGFVDRFEEMLAGYTGARRAVAVVNGTSALHVCLKLSGVGPGDEVLVPSLTFVATANAVTYCGAVPHFVESDERTLGVDPVKLGAYLEEIAVPSDTGPVNRKTGRRIAAVIPVHVFGHPVDMGPLIQTASRFGLKVVEDAAESLGSLYRGRHTGTMGLISAVSFNGNKIITTGGGGAILTDDEELGRLAKHLTTTARVEHPREITHDMSAFNYRLPNINAALGCAQMERLDDFLGRKRSLAARYMQSFEKIEGVRFFSECGFAKSNYWLNALILDEEHSGERERLMEEAGALGVPTRPAWTPMHRLPMFTGCPRMGLETTEALAGRIVCMPSSASLGEGIANA